MLGGGEGGLSRSALYPARPPPSRPTRRPHGLPTARAAAHPPGPRPGPIIAVDPPTVTAGGGGGVTRAVSPQTIYLFIVFPSFFLRPQISE